LIFRDAIFAAATSTDSFGPMVRHVADRPREDRGNLGPQAADVGHGKDPDERLIVRDRNVPKAALVHERVGVGDPRVRRERRRVRGHDADGSPILP
jgi:hypothetical protein